MINPLLCSIAHKRLMLHINTYKFVKQNPEIFLHSFNNFWNAIVTSVLVFKFLKLYKNANYRHNQGFFKFKVFYFVSIKKWVFFLYPSSKSRKIEGFKVSWVWTMCKSVSVICKGTNISRKISHLNHNVIRRPSTVKSLNANRQKSRQFQNGLRNNFCSFLVSWII